MTGVVGPSCDRGDGDGSSGFSSRLLHLPKLPSRLAFASQPERGAGGGGGGGGAGDDASSSGRWSLVVCGEGSDSKNRLPAKTVSWEHFFRHVATQHFSWQVLFTHHNELLHDPSERLHPQNALWELVSTVRNERRPRSESLARRQPHDTHLLLPPNINLPQMLKDLPREREIENSRAHKLLRITLMKIPNCC